MSLALQILSARRPQLLVQRSLRGIPGAMYRVGPGVCWKDTSRTIPAVLGDAVACLDDLSGKGNHMYQATAASRPILSLVGGRWALAFDGVDDLMRTNANFDIKAGGYLACASQYPSGASGSALGVVELCVNSSNYFRLGQVQSLGRSFAGSRGASATPSAVSNVQSNPSPLDSIPVDTPYVNSAILSSTGLTVIDSTGASTTNTNAPFGANVVPAANGSGVKLGFSTVGNSYLYQETIFGAVFSSDNTKMSEANVRAWLRSVSGAT